MPNFTHVTLAAVSSLGLSLAASAATLKIEDPCGGKPWLNVVVPHDEGLSAGAVTVSELEKNKIIFEGSEYGIVSIKNTVTSTEAMEILGPNEMRAYGWCYSFNGVEPNVYASDIQVDTPNDAIVWYFGFAHYKNGEWISMCEPTRLNKPAYICSK